GSCWAHPANCGDSTPCRSRSGTPGSGPLQELVDGLGQLPADARHALQVFDTGAPDFLLPTEVAQQITPPGWSDAGDFLQARAIACLAATLTVRRDCKAVRFIADVLQQMQRGRFRWQHQFFVGTAENQRLLPCLAADAFGDA